MRLAHTLVCGGQVGPTTESDDSIEEIPVMGGAPAPAGASAS